MWVNEPSPRNLRAPGWRTIRLLYGAAPSPSPATMNHGLTTRVVLKFVACTRPFSLASNDLRAGGWRHAPHERYCCAPSIRLNELSSCSSSRFASSRSPTALANSSGGSVAMSVILSAWSQLRSTRAPPNSSEMLAVPGLADLVRRLPVRMLLIFKTSNQSLLGMDFP